MLQNSRKLPSRQVSCQFISSKLKKVYKNEWGSWTKKETKNLPLPYEWEEDFFSSSQCHIQSVFASSASLPLLDQWLLDLAFLTDLTNMLNDLNAELQGKDKTMISMISSVNAFKRKMQHLSSKLQCHDLANFTSELETQGKACVQLDSACYTEQIDNCLSEFDKCFQDFALLKPVATFMCYPFREDAEVDFLASKIATLFHLNSSGVEDEILTLQADIQLKSRAHGQFWNLLTEKKYPNMRKCATSLPALINSPYICESAFSHMKIIKSKYCSTMTDDHLEVCLRLATSSDCLDYPSMADSIQCKSSE
eukprot:XP_014770526.1 PREDICTED: general transcription factor II-I repeat domain-containing protein 2A-like [Octopus bimaculoides]